MSYTQTECYTLRKSVFTQGQSVFYTRAECYTQRQSVFTQGKSVIHKERVFYSSKALSTQDDEEINTGSSITPSEL